MMMLLVPLVVNMLRNRMELRTELIDYDQDQQMKFPKLPMQATLHSDFKM